MWSEIQGHHMKEYRSALCSTRCIAAASAPGLVLGVEETFKTRNRTMEVGSVARVGHVSLATICVFI